MSPLAQDIRYALSLADRVLNKEDRRFSGTDQNPYGVRDFVGNAARAARDSFPDPDRFHVVEYLERGADGAATYHRVALSEWPAWAEELRRQLHPEVYRPRPAITRADAARDYRAARDEFLTAWDAFAQAVMTGILDAATLILKPTKFLELFQRPRRSWVDRAARVAQQLLQGPLLGVTPARTFDGNSLGHARWMAEQLAARRVDGETKACRWLGYLQGWLVANGRTTLDAEKVRNFRSGR